MKKTALALLFLPILFSCKTFTCQCYDAQTGLPAYTVSVSSQSFSDAADKCQTKTTDTSNCVIIPSR